MNNQITDLAKQYTSFELAEMLVNSKTTRINFQ